MGVSSLIPLGLSLYGSCFSMGTPGRKSRLESLANPQVEVFDANADHSKLPLMMHAVAQVEVDFQRPAAPLSEIIYENGHNDLV